MNAFLWIVSVILVVAGVAGTVLPALPGVPLVFLGLLLAAWLDGFQKVGGWPLSILAVLAILSFVADLFAAAIGAKRVNASRHALVGAALGAIIGMLMGFAGLVLGPFLGAAAGEFLARRNLYRAGEVGVAAWVGQLLGTAVKLGLAFMMVAIFITAYLWK